MSDRSRRELTERIDELEATLEELREELEPSRGPMGLPRPPRPRELLRFTDEYAIPAAISALEANVRALELLQAGIRATDTERTVDRTSRALGDRASGVGRTSLDRLDRALADLESAIEGTGMPGNREARDLLSDARRLNEEIRDRVEAGGAPTERGVDRTGAIRIEVEEESAVESARNAEGSGEDGDEPGSRTARTSVDVEEELETVKEEVESERERDERARDEDEE